MRRIVANFLSYWLLAGGSAGWAAGGGAGGAAVGGGAVGWGGGGGAGGRGGEGGVLPLVAVLRPEQPVAMSRPYSRLRIRWVVSSGRRRSPRSLRPWRRPAGSSACRSY